MKLSKALKVKNMLAGDVANAQRLINEANVVEGENKPTHNVQDLYEGLKSKQDALAAHKGKIAVANGPISGKIFRMSELKARISFLRSIPTKDGEHAVEGRYGSETKFRQYTATLKASWVEKEVSELQKEIEKLQDEIDEFNATTEI